MNAFLFATASSRSHALVVRFVHREASHALKSYIQGSSDLEFDPPFLQDGLVQPVFLELGSGMGVVASTICEHLAQTGFLLFVTDLPDVCPLLEKNLANLIRRPIVPPSSNGPVGSVFVRPLAWGNKEHALQISNELSRLSIHDPYLTHIVCSDLVSDFSALSHRSNTYSFCTMHMLGITYSPSRLNALRFQPPCVITQLIPTAAYAGILSRATRASPSHPHSRHFTTALPSTWIPLHSQGDHIVQNPKSGQGDGVLVCLRPVVLVRAGADQISSSERGWHTNWERRQQAFGLVDTVWGVW